MNRFLPRAYAPGLACFAPGGAAAPGAAPLKPKTGLGWATRLGDRVSPTQRKPRWVGHRQIRSVTPKSGLCPASLTGDRKSTRLNSSHQIISYAVFCLKKQTSATHSYAEEPWV